MGSYSASAGSGTCTACGNGKTTSGAGSQASTSCTDCSNKANVATWKTQSWSANSVANLCTINTCSAGYTLSNNTCVAITYTVAYNKNNTSAGGSTTSSSHTYDTAKKLTANGFTLAGHLFNGWNTKTDETGTSYANEESVTNLTTTDGGTVNLYAKWSACGKGYYALAGATSCTKCVQGSYSASAGSGTCTACGNGKTTSGAGSQASTACTDCSNKANVATWETQSWNSSNNTVTNLCKIKTCASGYKLSNNACEKNEFTLTYDSEGGSTCNSITKSYNEAWGTLCSPTKTGYTFLGWNTKADGTGTTITSSSKATADITVHARWGAKVYTLVRRTENHMKGNEDKLSKIYGATYTRSGSVYNVSISSENYSGIMLPDSIFVKSRRYVIIYKLQKKSGTGNGTLKKIGGSIDGATQKVFTINGVNSTISYDDKTRDGTNVSDNNDEYNVRLEIVANGGDDIYIQPNRGIGVAVNITVSDLDVYEIFSEDTKEYGSYYLDSELGVEIFENLGIEKWYKNNNLSTPILSASTIFSNSTAVFDNIATEGTNAYIFGDVVAKSSIPVYCILTADKNGIFFDKKAGDKWVINESSSKPATSSFGTSTTKVAFGTVPDSGKTFYGHIIDNSNNYTTCTIKITKSYTGTCTSRATSYYSGSCGCGGDHNGKPVSCGTHSTCKSACLADGAWTDFSGTCTFDHYQCGSTVSTSGYCTYTCQKCNVGTNIDGTNYCKQ